MNFKGYIVELKFEISKIKKSINSEKNEIYKKWDRLTEHKYRQGKELRELNRKKVVAGLNDVVDIQKRINALEEIMTKYDQYKQVKDQKIYEIENSEEPRIGEVILIYIEKLQEAIKEERSKFTFYTENVIESMDENDPNTALNLNSLTKRFLDFKKINDALEELKKYNGHIKTQERCDAWKEGLQPEDAEVIQELFDLITGNPGIDMRKIKIKKVEEEPIVTFEVNKDADITKLTNTNLNLKQQDFLNYLSEKPLEEIVHKEMKELIKLHDEVEFTELEEILFNGLVMSYNIFIENEYKKTISEENLETYDRNDIVSELLRKPKKIIFSTKLAEFIGKKIISSYETKISNADNVLEEDRFESIIDNINTDLKEKYMINGVLLFIAKNRLANIKLRLYKNDNLFETEKHCEEYRKNVEFISRTISKKLDKLTKTENGKKDLDCILLLLDQYLEVISIGDYEQVYNDFMEYLNVVSTVVEESIYRAYKAAADMIVEYRKTNKYTPYEMKYVNIEYGEFYNEIDDMIKFYDNEAKEFNNIENAIYLKRG